jgi:hypothetical protein
MLQPSTISSRAGAELVVDEKEIASISSNDSTYNYSGIKVMVVLDLEMDHEDAY